MTKDRKRFPTKEAMRSAGVHNSWELAKLLPPADWFFISHTSRKTGRGSMPAKFQVTHLRLRTDPEAHWSDYGKKTFTFGISSKAARLQEAIDWANERFGTREWIKDPHGSFQQRSVLNAVWALIDSKQPDKVE